MAEVDGELLGDSADAVMALPGNDWQDGDGRPCWADGAARQAARQIALATMTWSM